MLTPQDIVEYQRIYRDVHRTEVSKADALQQATDLLRFCNAAYSIFKKSRDAEEVSLNTEVAAFVPFDDELKEKVDEQR
jgi:hypothetical protein